VTACSQPGCGGTIEPEGYCSLCGLAPAPAAVPVAGEQGSGSGAAGSGSVSVPVPRSGGTSTGSGPGGRQSARGRLGAGLIEIPPVPARDPSSAVLTDPRVPEDKRTCSACERPVGRARGGRPGREEGFCARCGHPFSYSPKLRRGELVGGQYEVLGCLAHGGLGWIYLAKDRNVSNKWVVLKGLLDSGDPDAQQAAVAERRFLAEVEHPNIVRIINFVPHRDLSGTTTGYIVMEYVGGQSLKQILKVRREARESLPLTHALAHAIEVLPALGYLHSRGLLFCDFKPDNVIQVEEQVKLIDLGGVRRTDDDDSAIWGTRGYEAPEIAKVGPSVASDLYTVGRALAVLTFDFTGYAGKFQHSLPGRDAVPLFAEHDSFYRLLRRATDPDPVRRFASAHEMSEQATGVLREVLAVADGRPRPALSTLFSPERQAIGAAAVIADGTGLRDAAPDAADIVAGLPVPAPDGGDAAAGYLATLSALGPARQAAELAAVTSGAPGTPAGLGDSVEVRLALARARIAVGDLDGAEQVLAELIAQDRADWRVTWYQGLRGMAAGRPADALAQFDAVYDALPGELAPKLAVALAAEATARAASGNTAATAAGPPELDRAARLFSVVWTVDHSYVSAALGLARVRLATGDLVGAVEVLAEVPETSSHYLTAQIAAVRARISDPARLAEADLQEAGRRLERLQLDTRRQESLAIEILAVALGWVTSGSARAGAGSGPPGGGAPGSGAPGSGTAGAERLLDCDLNERALRFGLEKSYRALARLASRDERRIELVDLANDVRPRTRF
jgi:serine/threonine-protein kinase PknG